MGVFNRFFPLGLGTSRFPIIGPNDEKGLEASVRLVSRAMELGVNYIDTSYPYSAGMAQTVLKEAFKDAKKPFGVTVKVMHDMDKTADDARRRAEMQLEAMGLASAEFFVCWTIPSYAVFLEMMKKDGVYEGALRLKDEGIIKHICCSLHAATEDSIKIIESGAFEGATISHSLLSYAQSSAILDAAQRSNVDVAVMNPLGGGVIAQNQEFFAFARGRGETTVTAALRFAKAHPAVKLVLSGLNDESELEENINAITGKYDETDEERVSRISGSLKSIKNFCVNCKYCEGCPQGIPVPELMNKRNALLFTTKERYNRTDPELLQNISLLYTHANLGTSEWMPETDSNPCTRCGACEAKCTQKLRIIEAINDTFERAKKVGYSLEGRKERVRELLFDKGYKKVGLYPNGGFANMIMELYNSNFGEPEFEWLQFNSDPKMWGQKTGGVKIRPPKEISAVKPDIIIICTYKYDKDIYESLKHYRENGIKIVKLHRENDVPWVF